VRKFKYLTKKVQPFDMRNTTTNYRKYRKRTKSKCGKKENNPLIRDEVQILEDE
jgi:hypothetical protein